MLFTVDSPTAILAVLLLLALSLITVEFCRRDRAKGPQSLLEFLFQAKNVGYSIASNAGAMFSLTYFFGAAFVYGFVFGYWYLLATAAIFLLVVFLLLLVVEQERGSNIQKITGNMLLDRLNQKLSAVDFRITVRLYVISYACLIIEELAVSRVVLGLMLEPSKILHLGLLALMCLVVFFYLYLGGFRAVLTSDLVQMAMVAGFLVCLVFTLVREGLPLASGFELRGPQSALVIAMNSGFIVIFGVAWFVAGVDYYSRLNFELAQDIDEGRQKRFFIVAGFVATFAVLSIGILYGIHLRQVFPSISSPVDYTANTIDHFLQRTRPAIAIMFIGSVFCMIFTTFDTLLLTLLQLGYLSEIRLLRREGLSRLLLVLVFLSTLLEENSVSVFGIFSGSLLILPAAASISVLFPKLRRFIASDFRALETALVLFSIFFLVFYSVLETAFEYHFLIPGVLVLLVLTTSLGFRVRQVFANRRSP